MGNKQSHSEADDTVAEATASRGKVVTTSAAVEDAEEPVEVPPPMQPISSVPLSTAVDDLKKVGIVVVWHKHSIRGQCNNPERRGSAKRICKTHKRENE